MPAESIHPFLFRHPVSAGSHVLFCLWTAYTAALFFRLTRDRTARRSVACFGSSVVFLYASSAAYHSLPSDQPGLVEMFRLLDLAAIHLLIAGTCTVAVAPWTHGRTRVVLLVIVWTLAAGGVASKWLLPLPPYPVTVGLYLAQGAAGLALLPMLAPAVGWTGLAWLAGGALVYAAGGACDAARWPVPWPGIIGPHEVLHLCDMVGTLTHFVFVGRFVVPGTHPPITPCRSS